LLDEDKIVAQIAEVLAALKMVDSLLVVFLRGDDNDLTALVMRLQHFVEPMRHHLNTHRPVDKDFENAPIARQVNINQPFGAVEATLVRRHDDYCRLALADSRKPAQEIGLNYVVCLGYRLRIIHVLIKQLH
jgi:hypothetical protein